MTTGSKAVAAGAPTPYPQHTHTNATNHTHTQDDEINKLIVLCNLKVAQLPAKRIAQLATVNGEGKVQWAAQ